VQFADWDDGSGKIEELVATYREYNLANHDAMVTLYDGIAEMLHEVRAAGHRTALVTSKNRWAPCVASTSPASRPTSRNWYASMTW
jgi:phosphoglycolate phosphatase-like HAD superfamily hydrolase